MLILTDPNGRVPPESLDEAIGTLEQLVSDLRDLRAVGIPNPAVLEAAPILDPWSFATTPAPCAVGLSFGHPLLPGSGRPIATSPLWIAAPGAGWVRTTSRYYRLGRPLGNHGPDQ